MPTSVTAKRMKSIGMPAMAGGSAGAPNASAGSNDRAHKRTVAMRHRRTRDKEAPKKLPGAHILRAINPRRKCRPAYFCDADCSAQGRRPNAGVLKAQPRDGKCLRPRGKVLASVTAVNSSTAALA